MISVLTLTYRRPHLLNEAIFSFLSQTDCDFDHEMVVVNDQPDVEYVFDHPKVRIINHKQRFSSISSKLANSFSSCKNEYIYRLDDDDLLAPWALEISRRNIEANPGYDVYRSDGQYFFLNNKYERVGSNVNNGNIYTKNYLSKINFSDKSFGEDVEITYGHNGRIFNFSDKRKTMIYRWGMNTYHVSGLGDISSDEMRCRVDNIAKDPGGFGVVVIGITPSFYEDYYGMIWHE